MYSQIDNINTINGAITVFMDSKCIVHGTYKESGQTDLFKHENEAGELFALLIDPQTKEPTPVSKK